MIVNPLPLQQTRGCAGRDPAFAAPLPVATDVPGLPLTPGWQYEATYLAVGGEQVALPRQLHWLVAARGYGSRRNYRRARPPQVPAAWCAKRNAAERVLLAR